MSNIIEYNIVCISDELYAQHTAVMLKSLLETNKKKSFNIFLLTTDLSDESIKKIHSVVKGGATLSVIEFDINKVYNLACETDCKSWSPTMYIKLFIPDYLPCNVNRALFLDVDLVVNAEIYSLYDFEFNGNIIAACEDYLYCDTHKKRLGLFRGDLYINSGVMMMDISAWRDRQQNISMTDFLYSMREVIRNDQDVFAMYFKGAISLLPTNQWNATTFFFEKTPRVLSRYIGEVDKVRKNPYIIHFCEPIKPWYKECKHPYRNLYKKYLKKTPWANYKFITCESAYGKPSWVYTLKYWLNVFGLRNDDMAMIRKIQ